MKLGVIGTGYVGLVTGACFAETGNDVVCADTDRGKIDKLERGQIPFFEPGLEELVANNVRQKRLRFSTNVDEAMKGAAIAFICVGTPSAADGSADLTYVLQAAADIAASGAEPVVTLKSTVPVGTADTVRKHLAQKGKGHLRVASNPEFLREGTAVSDCMQPDRIIVGTDSPEVAGLFRELYASFVRTGSPILVMDNRSAEMSKYAANALLASRISFVNEIAMLCERVGADVAKVREGMGTDNRIGMKYLHPSIGFGGSCFPKDVRALAHLAEGAGVEPGLLGATLAINEKQKRNFLEKMFAHFGGKASLKGRRVAIWGVAFKAKTDDIRESPALTVIDGLLEAGAKVAAYDPAANENVRSLYANRVDVTESMYDALKGADALCVLTEWNQFRHPDFAEIKSRLASPVVFDGRNLYDPAQMKKLGFTYAGIGKMGTHD